jgi:hypothetical protein
MKKVLLLILALIVVLACVSFTGCLKKGLTVGDDTIHIADSEGGGDITVQGLGGEGKTPEDFGDIPIYPGCTQLMKIVGDETMNGLPGVIDHRMYLTTDSVEKVIKFYKVKMPENGWTEEMWAESTINMGQYNKGENKVAVISIVAADAQGGANINIDKKYAK